ncbi:Os06g0679750, partial [Oryza sativa Japonica Group]
MTQSDTGASRSASASCLRYPSSMARSWVGESAMRRPMWSTWTRTPPPPSAEEASTGKGRRERSPPRRGSSVGRPARRRRRLMLEKGACDEAAPAAWGPRRRALWEKATAAGDSRLDSALRSTSMPRCRAAAATRVSLPTSKPTTLI